MTEADTLPKTRSRIGPMRAGLVLAAGLAAMGLLYALGFGLFIATLPAPVTAPREGADAIVALTGEGDRLGPAVMLLEKGIGHRLLITGVNKLTTKHELKALLHAGGSFDCCADLGFAATDTRGNAEETAQWVRAHHFGSLVVVTAAFHMPRSLLEFGAQMPGVKLIPYPVPLEVGNTAQWDSFKRLTNEYAKYLASLVRISMTERKHDDA